MHHLLLAVCSFLIIAASVVAPRETNGQRLARGLPPLKPKFRSFSRGMQARDDPPFVLEAKRSTPSGIPTPLLTYRGRIQVRNTEGSILGFVRDRSDGDISGVEFSSSAGLHVAFSIFPEQENPFDIITTSPGYSDHPRYIGAISEPAPSNFLAAGSANSASFKTVPKSSPNTPGISSDGIWLQSSIWHFNSSTKEITAQYINPDGSKHPTIIDYDIRENCLFFVGDADARNKANPDLPSSPVRFFLED